MDVTTPSVADATRAARPVPTRRPRPVGVLSQVSGPTRTIDFLLGALVLVTWTPPGTAGALSLGLLAAAALVGLATLRPPAHGLTHIQWLLPLLAALLMYLAAVSALSPDGSLYGWEKRELRIALVLLLLVVLVTGRVHYASVVRGATVGLIANAVLFFAGAAPRPYGEFLSGFLMDKNQAGLMYAAVGLLFAGLQSSRNRQMLALAATSALVWTTGSRTSLAALACGIAWFLLRPRLAPLGRLALAGSLALFVQVLESDYARIGVFADRFGTDWFRARIDAASLIKLDSTPWQGLGLGEAWVKLNSGDFFFHNSYWGALVEGGWVLLAFYLVLTVWIGIGPLRPGPPAGPWASAAEAANVVVLVCALRLGDVFGTTVAILALTGGILGYLAHRDTADARAPG